MKLFFDMEFTGLHQGTTPISLGIVSEDGRAFYAEFSDYDRYQLDDWLRENVVAHLLYDEGMSQSAFANDEYDSLLEIHGTRYAVTEVLKDWLAEFSPMVEMWGDCLAYDWVLFCQLFGGGAECLPRNIYYIPYDLCTLLWCTNNNSDVNRIEFSGLEAQKHNALSDAKVIKACYDRIMKERRDGISR